MDWNYPLTSDTFGAEERAAVLRVLDRGRYTMGDGVRAFERAFAGRIGRRHAVMTNSGSSANLIATAALTLRQGDPLRRGDEAIVPAIAWATTWSPLHQHGLRMRVVDVDLETLNIDAAQLERALTTQTRAVVAVSILGNPAPLPELRAFCDRHGLALLEDNCESLGAEIGGRPTGAFGDLATFSMFFSHHLTTMEGGMVVTDDDELHHLLLALRAHGWSRELPRHSRLHDALEDDFDEAYRFLIPGYNVRPLEMSGEIGLVQLEKLDAGLAARRANAAHFRSLFAGDSRFVLQRENGRSSWFSFTMVVRPGLALERRRVLELLRPAGIEFRMITGGNLLRHPVASHYDLSVVDGLPAADAVHDRGFFLGNFSRDARAEIDLVHRTLREALEHAA